MRFIVDECTGPAVSKWLQSLGHNVLSIYDEYRGATDSKIIEIAWREHRIIITNDKDFGEKIFRERRRHHGVVLLRLNDERSSQKTAALEQLLNSYHDSIEDNFVVVTERQVRFAKSG